MKIIPPLRGLAVLALLLLAPCALAVTIPPYQKHSFKFVQYGYDQGAYVTGQFDAFDSNGDGIISWPYDFTYQRPEFILGIVTLVGHPSIWLSIGLYEGGINTNTMEFSIAGDDSYYFGGEFYPGVVWWATRHSSFGEMGAFGNLPEYFPILSSREPLIITRVPDTMPTAIALGISLLFVTGMAFHRSTVYSASR
jgi:hypothetical protein